ncbi:hypothetical protein Y1Q_0009932 [Alligator mississippiensis]|uniref:Uncharacterized protein n=1 Tax=Alligator mississippiensis TaxID=8496 RepID=A0A151MXH9_ALLMI|nr:hypothetical protein Y1Q_0009932 [Alligator mississippiensis]
MPWEELGKSIEFYTILVASLGILSGNKRRKCQAAKVGGVCQQAACIIDANRKNRIRLMEDGIKCICCFKRIVN